MDMVALLEKKLAPIERGASIARVGNPPASLRRHLVAGLRPLPCFATAMYPACICEEIPPPEARTAP
jgi:hypothetical protein